MLVYLRQESATLGRSLSHRDHYGFFCFARSCDVRIQHNPGGMSEGGKSITLIIHSLDPRSYDTYTPKLIDNRPRIRAS